jgi:hypothetical protein
MITCICFSMCSFDNPGGGGAKHHPSKAFHMWRGEAIVWLHALTLLDAIYMLEKDLQTGKSRADLAKGEDSVLN